MGKVFTERSGVLCYGGKSTKYFSFRRGACQSNPIPAFLFVLALESLFLLIKLKPEIKGMTVFD